MTDLAGIPIWIWGVFLAFVLGMLALDLGVFHRKSHEVGVKEALIWSGVWVGLALVFNLGIFLVWEGIAPGSEYTPREAGLAFLAGYLIEKALSVDNIFVFLVVFSYFAVPARLQHRVLFWGIVGALVFRALFVALGATLLERFAWTMVLFGLFLIGTGVKLALSKDKKVDPGKNPLVRIVHGLMPVTSEYQDGKFFTRIGGRLCATPLFIALLVIEFTDIVFAIDSIPAIYAITSEPFIVFTSNIFAILGLRSLFFALSGLMQMFHYLSYGLSAVLVFVGGKMLYGYLEKTVWPEWPKFPVVVSLAVVVSVLAIAIIASVKWPPRARELAT